MLLPSHLLADEIELIINCLDICFQYRYLTLEERNLATQVREKLLAYLRDEPEWHGRIF